MKTSPCISVFPILIYLNPASGQDCRSGSLWCGSGPGFVVGARILMKMMRICNTGIPITAPGRDSTALGRASTAPGRASTSQGRASTAPGRASTAPGRASTAPGWAEVLRILVTVMRILASRSYKSGSGFSLWCGFGPGFSNEADPDPAFQTKQIRIWIPAPLVSDDQQVIIFFG